ncbi:ATP-binding protein [Candidatus Thiothrix sp. Deng01]|uniref:histidine kinase n=1 Tax=Candidatus Thiothrix phosphatis TaxID=3112415 RepID=A0ABU6D251_9GAMM|nr:ATP-binding protein [Candidatus Thiothrix sp. Deng01]MEB4593155.1 ATP-binding protein [Candidatus Thiothrix sp. Deng01]
MSDSVRIFHEQHLSHRFIVFLFGVLGLVSVCFLLMFYYFYNSQLAGERTQASHAVSLLLESSLQRAMLRRDLPGLRDIIHDLGKEDGVRDVMILNPAGEVRFASHEEYLGQQAADVIQQFCPGCTSARLPVEPVSRFLVTDKGEILRTFQPVRNRPQCMECHGDAGTHPVNGILVVDHDAAPIRQKGLMNVLVLAGAGSIAVLFSAWAAWWFMQRYVLLPVRQLDTASRALSRGELATRVPVAGQDEMANLASTFNHMAERLQHNHQVLHSREKFLQGLVDAVPDGVRVIDPYYQIVVANRAYAELSGIASPADLRQQYCYKVAHQRDAPCPPSLCTCPLEILKEQQAGVKFMETLQREDGSLLSTEVYAARLLLADNVAAPSEFLVVESVRDLEKAAQYSHEQKLASLGELAAGVAHEIHNPLGSVRIALQASDRILDASQEDVSELRDYLHLVDEQVEQCLDVTHRLMKLGSLSSGHPELVEVNTVICETLSLLRFEREQRGIRERLDLAPCNPRILAADNDLRMVVLNLAQNAFHAMPTGGELCIVSRCQGDEVVIRFRDTGTGIANEVLPYIFDPFFSRRCDQRGSGLGLTITRSLVQQHGGHIDVAAHTPGNTEFVLRFPDADAANEEAANDDSPDTGD